MGRVMHDRRAQNEKMQRAIRVRLWWCVGSRPSVWAQWVIAYGVRDPSWIWHLLSHLVSFRLSFDSERRRWAVEQLFGEKFSDRWVESKKEIKSAKL